ncbi:MAG: DUF3570 domain-containing protein [Myxococcota bacterium]
MRLQLIAMALVASSAPAIAQAQASVRTGASLYEERRGPLNARAFTTNLDGRARVSERVELALHHEADVITAASVAVVDSPADLDAITSATRMNDVRQRVGANVAWEGDSVTVRGGYNYGSERDYRSHAVQASIERRFRDVPLTLNVSGSVASDRVCDVAGNGDLDPLDRERLPNAEGCFSSDERRSAPIRSQGAELALTYLARRDVAMQLVTSVQRSQGLLSSPYREVWLGPFAAAEHHPSTRVRASAALGVRVALPRLAATLRTQLRAYRDSWGINAGSGEVGYQQRLPKGLRLDLRFRVYRQSGAAFYSDDYAQAPRGQYFTGDRELSPMRNTLGGLALYWTVPGIDDQSPVDSLRLALAFTLARPVFSDFQLGTGSYPNGFWSVSTFSMEVGF